MEPIIKLTTALDYLLKLIELLRPKFYNRLTWLIVISGLSLMSTPVWEKLLEAALKLELNISISGGNDTAWGFALCTLALVYHLANTGLYELLQSRAKQARNEQEIEHDRKIFNSANAALSEEQLDDLIVQLRSDHSYYTNEASRLDSFCRLLAATNNTFLTGSLNDKTQMLLSTSLKLREFMSHKFFVFPKSQTRDNLRLCMVPGLNCDRDGNGSPEQMKKYEKLSAELDALTDDIFTCYTEWRSAIKQTLVI